MCLLRYVAPATRAGGLSGARSAARLERAVASMPVAKPRRQAAGADVAGALAGLRAVGLSNLKAGVGAAWELCAEAQIAYRSHYVWLVLKETTFVRAEAARSEGERSGGL